MLGFNPLYAACILALGGLQPTFATDFTLGALSPAFTLSRASNATTFDSQGRLVWAPANMFINSEQVGGTGWSSGGAITGITSLVPSTGNVVHGTNTSTSNVLGMPVAVTLRAKAEGYNFVSVSGSGFGGNGFTVDLSTGSAVETAGTTNFSVTDVGDGWWEIYFERVPASATTFIVRIGPTAATATAYAGDGVSGVAVTRTGWWPIPNTNGYVANPSTSSAYYGPRFDYNPATLSAMGLLIEESRTNLVTLSSFWGTIFGGTCVKNVTGISGEPNSAYTYTAITGSAQHLAGGNAGTFTTGVVTTLSAFVKAGSETRCQIACSNSIATEYANFSLVGAGSVLLQNASSNAAIQKRGDGWFRISMAITPLASIGGSVFVAMINSDTATRIPTFVAAGNTFLVCESQIEAGSFHTSLIPTFGTAATRALETCVNSSAAAWFVPEHTALCEYESHGLGGVSVMAYSLDDGTIANRLFLIGNATQQAIANNIAGVDQGNVAVNVGCSRGTFIRTARRTKTADFNVAANGTVGGTDFAGNVTTGVTTLRFGGSASGALSAVLNGHVKSFRFYPVAMTNAELQDATS